MVEASLLSTLVLPLAFSRGIVIWIVFVTLAFVVITKGWKYDPDMIVEHTKKSGKVNKAHSIDDDLNAGKVVKAVVAAKVIDAIKDDEEQEDQHDR